MKSKMYLIVLLSFFLGDSIALARTFVTIEPGSETIIRAGERVYVSCEYSNFDEDRNSDSPGGCNVHGCWSTGGGCNVHGCWNEGGNCNVHGCSNRGECNVHGCP